MLRVIGEVVRYTSEPYDIANDDGSRNTGTSRRARIQTSRADFVDVMFPQRMTVPEPRDGDLVDYLVEPRAVQARAGAVQIRVLGIYEGRYVVADTTTGAVLAPDGK